MLEPEEIKRRLDAARTLRGLKQTELAEMVHADGLGKHDVGRLERGDIPLTRALRDSLCRHLRVPDTWFTDDEVNLLNVPTESEERDQIAHEDATEKRLGALIEQQNALLREQSEILRDIRETVAAQRAASEDMQKVVSTQLDAARQMEEAAEMMRTVDPLPPAPSPAPPRTRRQAS